ncbi:MAG TPA: hypothetical protein ENI89_01825 [Desulfobulbus sp.]|nr:hypothetical protein [Desulfobulbus sp.]
MTENAIPRKSLDSQEFLQLRQATEKIGRVLQQRLKEHLTILRPLFIPRKLLGTYIRSSSSEEVHGSDKAFAELQERYAVICEEPFALPKKLQPPLPPISNFLESTPFRYTLTLESDSDRQVVITSATRFILSFQGECPLARLKGMLNGSEARQADDMRQALINHLAMVLFLEHFPALVRLLNDLNYQVQTHRFDDLGGLEAVVLSVPLKTFLPPDDFIVEVTQLSGIPAFQELIEKDAVSSIPDPLQEALQET